MICDRIQRLGHYRGINRNLDALIDQLPDFQLDAMPDGRHELEGDTLFLNLMKTSLGSGVAWEAHREYYDLQLVLENEETIAWVPAEDIQGFGEYDPARDIMTSGDPQPGTPVRLKPGMFALLSPQDAHRPCIGQGTGRKAVFKIRVPAPAQPSQTESPLRHLGTQALNTPRLLLRPYRVGDAEEMFNNWAGDPEVTRTLMWQTHPDVSHTRRLLFDWVRAYGSGQSYHWAIQKDGELVGDIAVMRWSGRDLDCEIGYCLSRRFWSQGIMTEALRRVMVFLFTQVGFRRIILRHDAKNPASGRVMQKAGLKPEGVHREALIRKDGSFADVPQYAALRDEWLAEQGIPPVS